MHKTSTLVDLHTCDWLVYLNIVNVHGIQAVIDLFERRRLLMIMERS